MKLLNRINNVLLQMIYSLLVKSQKAASQIVTIVCVLFLIGCDNDNSNNGVVPERARLLKTTPPVTAIERFAPEMEIVFDKPVTKVQVNGVDAHPNDPIPTALWTLDLSHFEPLYPPRSTEWTSEQFCLMVSYTDESGSYQENLGCVELPHLFVEPNPPTIISGTVQDGDVGVDAEILNLYGITLRFSEPVTGSLIIHPEGQEESLCWNVEWSEDGMGESVSLRRGTGKKLFNGRAYTIAIEVRDERGQGVFPSEITFTTKE